MKNLFWGIALASEASGLRLHARVYPPGDHLAYPNPVAPPGPAPPPGTIFPDDPIPPEGPPSTPISTTTTPGPLPDTPGPNTSTTPAPGPAIHYDLTSSNGDNSCYVEADQGASYRGLVTSSKSGRQCQKWTQDKPHAAAVTVNEGATSEAGLGNHNYCRNPDGSMPKPWCFTLDSGLEKEECEIPVCTQEGAFARNFHDESNTLASNINATDCDCADQLYGKAVGVSSFAQFKNKRVGVDKKTGKPCDCGSG